MVYNNICIIDGVSTCMGVRIIRLLNRRLDELRRRYPKKLRKRVIKVIYTLISINEALEDARKINIDCKGYW
ncbi:MAG: hypothetical protein QXX95_03890 [Nitrososphaerales archaeon]